MLISEGYFSHGQMKSSGLKLINRTRTEMYFSLMMPNVTCINHVGK